MAGIESLNFWQVVAAATAWRYDNASKPTDHSLDSALAFAANIYLVSKGLRGAYNIVPPETWTTPPRVAGVQCQVREMILLDTRVRGFTYYVHAEAALGAPEDLYPRSTPTGTLRWIASGDSTSFELWNEPVPANPDLDKIIARSRSLGNALAPFLLTVQVSIE